MEKRKERGARNDDVTDYIVDSCGSRTYVVKSVRSRCDRKRPEVEEEIIRTDVCTLKMQCEAVRKCLRNAREDVDLDKGITAKGNVEGVSSARFM